MPSGYQVNWTPEMEALLGEKPDGVVGSLLGISKAPVRKRRCELGIDPFRFTWWTPEMDDLLGTKTDRKVSIELGVSVWIVKWRRHRLGIPSWQSQHRILPEGLTKYDAEALRIYDARRRHQELELANTLTYEQWLFACEWFSDRCAYCGKKAFLTEEHLVPVSKGGPRTVLNIIPACSSCNSSKHNKQAHKWIYWKFGMIEGKKIVERIVEYLTTVKDKE